MTKSKIKQPPKKKARSNVAKNTKEQELVITRIFDAPRVLVWKAWTEPALHALVR